MQVVAAAEQDKLAMPQAQEAITDSDVNASDVTLLRLRRAL
jgi:hypothetical protein